MEDTFQISMGPVLTFVQFLALMPIVGVSQKDPKALRFKWKSFRTVFTLLYISYGVIISSYFYSFIIAAGISAKNIGKF